ncbi:hypothetical protein M427DRAFT_367407 [Gonapodya prolifera JEL478]|uniref:F-box domain-containing protein n=1 Tax=Gonapodya prolifera (strain JEL478) TaxID=1344416 RepID=A0A139A9I0_GONPJ|nr:hypothetical protein M427DRAFT_367407 [Gonapodya prolifera JEL478]|eukprot:KXS13460.1 hypothetical protein M427DRAFT_367407 [Gonapodya prolifera JEL478]
MTYIVVPTPRSIPDTYGSPSSQPPNSPDVEQEPKPPHGLERNGDPAALPKGDIKKSRVATGPTKGNEPHGNVITEVPQPSVGASMSGSAVPAKHPSPPRGNLPSLPPRVLRLVARHLDHPRDLSSLSLASSYHAGIVRPILFADVRTNNPTRDTLRLAVALASPHGIHLARSVKRLQVGNLPGASWVALVAQVANQLPNLANLVVSGRETDPYARRRRPRRRLARRGGSDTDDMASVSSNSQDESGSSESHQGSSDSEYESKSDAGTDHDDDKSSNASSPSSDADDERSSITGLAKDPRHGDPDRFPPLPPSLSPTLNPRHSPSPSATCAPRSTTSYLSSPHSRLVFV